MIVISGCLFLSAHAVAMEKNAHQDSTTYTLPYELQTQEIVKQIINTATSRQQAMLSLNNYRHVNKAIAQYIDKNQQLLKNILYERFALETLASGAFNNSDVKKRSIAILEEARKYKFMQIDPARDIINLINSKDRITSQNINSFIALLKRSIKEKNFLLSAAIIGALRYFVNTKRLVFDPYIKNHFVQVLETVADMGLHSKNGTAQIRELYDIINTFATKEFGPL
jgi:hypothetical protein